MKWYRLAGVGALCLLTAGSARAATAAVAADGTAAVVDSVPLFRVFLKDGTSLVSYGEFARVGDRVVFSMPTSASTSAPQLQLINIPSDSVDWTRTGNYADALRAQQYLATRAEADYRLLSDEIAQALNEVGSADDPKRRLAIVEKARKALADWPASHYNYKRQEIQQMLGTLDEAIANLRAASGANTFDLTFVAAADPPPSLEPILPPPDARETIEATVRAAQLTTSPPERVSLLTTAANALESDSTLPPDWVETTRTRIQSQIAQELETDRKYRALGARMLRLANARARTADVRGVQRVLASIKANDEALGSARPAVIASMVATVESKLDEARRLRLERDRWALRAPDLRAYRTSVAASLTRLQRLTPLLEDIKALAGSGPDALGTILRGSAQIEKALGAIEPPSELREAHNLFMSAVQLAGNAAKIRREAAINGSMTRAWDASSAAAGALMLADRARKDMQVALTPPQLAR